MFDGQAHGAAGHAERAFSGNVNRIRFEFVEPLFDLAARKQGELDLGIRRQGNGPEPVARMNNFPDMPHCLGFSDYPLHRANDAVDLRVPGVGDQHDAHGGSLRALSGRRQCGGVGPGRKEAELLQSHSRFVLWDDISLPVNKKKRT